MGFPTRLKIASVLAGTAAGLLLVLAALGGFRLFERRQGPHIRSIHAGDPLSISEPLLGYLRSSALPVRQVDGRRRGAPLAGQVGNS